MTSPQDRETVSIEQDGRMLAKADVAPGDQEGVVRSAMHVESGHLPTGTRTQLVDAVLDLPQVSSAERIVATMPISDTEMLDRVRERADDVQARPAGATKIVEARLEQTD